MLEFPASFPKASRLSTPAEVWSYRTLIANLAQRDLKARYKKSFLGWTWSLINPAVTLGIYTLVFGVFLKGTAPVAGNGRLTSFAIYLFCGLVLWNLASGVVNNSIGSFLGAGDLLSRTYFPPEAPMVAGLTTVLIQGALELTILWGFMIAFGNVSWTFLVSIPVMLLGACFAFGIGLVLGLGNVRFRDVGYLVGIGLQVAFYATPIVYRLDQIGELAQRVLEFNPLTSYVGAMRATVYELDLPTVNEWLMMGGSATVSLLVGWWAFGRYAPRVIEEL
ncbi:MAG: ABC transporter permease [Actinobacteria bacterium]|nr:ABC transporter permease [Actinomycetota bacterium]